MRTQNQLPTDPEEDHGLRSEFMRRLISKELESESSGLPRRSPPRTLVRYWHDLNDIPDDVALCLASWDRLKDEGFKVGIFCDDSATEYIREKFGSSHVGAFQKCRHPAMRADFFRLCFLYEEGGLYVDADDVLLGDGWRELFSNGALKVQPLCYDLLAGKMTPVEAACRSGTPTEHMVFYVNNDPIASPPRHPIVGRALARSARKLLGSCRPEIQETTGPGNLTAALVAHARELVASRLPFDFQIVNYWDNVADTRWDLSYRNDSRNWRNMDS